MKRSLQGTEPERNPKRQRLGVSIPASASGSASGSGSESAPSSPQTRVGGWIAGFARSVFSLLVPSPLPSSPLVTTRDTPRPRAPRIMDSGPDSDSDSDNEGGGTMATTSSTISSSSSPPQTPSILPLSPETPVRTMTGAAASQDRSPLFIDSQNRAAKPDQPLRFSLYSHHQSPA